MADLAFIWKRPDTIEYPKIWHTFKARDLDSDKLVEYRIQDLPLNRFDDAYAHMVGNYNQDEPIAQVLGRFFQYFSFIKISFYSYIIKKYIFKKVVESNKNISMTINWHGRRWLSKKCLLYVSKKILMKSLVSICFLL